MASSIPQDPLNFLDTQFRRFICELTATKKTINDKFRLVRQKLSHLEELNISMIDKALHDTKKNLDMHSLQISEMIENKRKIMDIAINTGTLKRKKNFLTTDFKIIVDKINAEIQINVDSFAIPYIHIELPDPRFMDLIGKFYQVKITSAPPIPSSCSKKTNVFTIKKKKQSNNPLICGALYDFSSSDKHQLSFLKGEKLEILDKKDTAWWLAKSQKTRNIGLIPSNYVNLISKIQFYENFNDSNIENLTNPDSTAAITVNLNYSSSNELFKGKKPSKIPIESKYDTLKYDEIEDLNSRIYSTSTNNLNTGNISDRHIFADTYDTVGPSLTDSTDSSQPHITDSTDSSQPHNTDSTDSGQLHITDSTDSSDPSKLITNFPKNDKFLNTDALIENRLSALNSSDSNRMLDNNSSQFERISTFGSNNELTADESDGLFSEINMNISLCYAQHNFDARNMNEISFKTGEAFELIERVSGFWLKVKSRKTKKIGLIPGNYVHVFHHYDNTYDIPQVNISPVEISDEYEISSEDVEFTNRLEVGIFAEFWEGIYDASPVCIRKIRDYNQMFYEPLNEIAILKKLNHPNLIKLVGICHDEEPLCIIFEPMENGILKKFLSQQTCESLSFYQLMLIALQVILGMCYLVEKVIIHRDVAARSMYVGKDLNCKIGDFSTARQLKHTNYYADIENNKCQMGWKAPEIDKEKKSTNKSDVWSYGILLFELMTYGEDPYKDIHESDIIPRILDGVRCPQPPNCPNKLYEIMNSCWKLNPYERPTFLFLKEKFNYYIKNLSFK